MSFGYQGAEGTCLWCGRRLPGPNSIKGKYHESKFFDTGACAKAFGLRMAELGKRFQPIAPSEAQEPRRD